MTEISLIVTLNNQFNSTQLKASCIGVSEDDLESFDQVYI